MANSSAKKPLAKQITSWSFSRYSVYKQCPFKAKLKFIDKIAEPGNAAMERGDAIHKMAEAYIKGVSARLPKELKLFADTFKALRAQYKKIINGMHVEDSWSFKSDWSETVWNDWAGCWLRVKLDCGQEMPGGGIYVPTDWKTGKYRPEDQEDYLEQLELYALAVLVRLPHIQEVRPRLGYIDHGITYPPVDKPIIYTRAELPKLKKLWEGRVKAMLRDKSFPPRPNDKCKWCHYRKDNAANGGGQCKF